MNKFLSELRQIGFNEFVHLDKTKRDGKKDGHGLIRLKMKTSGF
jgi:hypothetical protein